MAKMVKAEIKGIPELTNKLMDGADTIDAEAKLQMVRQARVLHADIVLRLQSGPASGKERPNGKGRASAPGEAPMTDTGNLVRNTRIEQDNNESEVRVVVGTPYAAALEFGRADGSIEERPFVRPAFKDLKDGLGKVMVNGMIRHIRKEFKK